MASQPFDDRNGVIWYNGNFVPWREAKCHVLSHALHYASSVFEGERAYQGHIFKLNEHTRRLFYSAEQMGMKIPYSVDEIDAACRETLAKQGLKDAYVRPVVWRGPEMMGVSAQETKIHVAIAIWDWPSYFSPEARLKGIRLQWAQYRRPPAECAPVHAKAAGLYMICTLEKHAAEAAGYDDALMIDHHGHIAECTGANIFFIRDDVIHTPTPVCFLDGITRRTAIDLARKRGIEVVERTIVPDELSDFEQVFITGTAAEITPVAEIEGQQYHVGEPIKTLMEDYHALVRTPA